MQQNYSFPIFLGIEEKLVPYQFCHVHNIIWSPISPLFSWSCKHKLDSRVSDISPPSCSQFSFFSKPFFTLPEVDLKALKWNMPKYLKKKKKKKKIQFQKILTNWIYLLKCKWHQEKKEWGLKMALVRIK